MIARQFARTPTACMSLHNPECGRVRACPRCGQAVAKGEPDPCLGLIPGLSHACCGHGILEDAYAVIGGEPDQSCETFEYHTTIRGVFAESFFKLLRAATPTWPPSSSHET